MQIRVAGREALVPAAQPAGEVQIVGEEVPGVEAQRGLRTVVRRMQTRPHGDRGVPAGDLQRRHRAAGRLRGAR